MNDRPRFNSAARSVFSVAIWTGLPDSLPSQALIRYNFGKVSWSRSAANALALLRARTNGAKLVSSRTLEILMPKTANISNRQRGQTILLVAVSIVSLLAMAALAIDVVTLYVARSEIQRAADAAALAGAKAMADSGITTLPSGDSNCVAVQTLAKNMASDAINALLPNNLVVGSAPSLVTGSPSFSNFPTSCPINDPEVQVKLTRTGLPTFFARIWGRAAATVSASATAEAYNTANILSPTQFTPIAPKCVKPWLVANRDPNNAGTQFVNPATGAVEAGVLNPGHDLDLTADCPPPEACVNAHADAVPTWFAGPPRVEYLAASVTSNPSNVIPSCAGSSDYERSIESCDANSYAYLNCGGGSNYAQWDNTVDPSGTSGPSASGAQCLIHATGHGSGKGQDTLDNSAWPDGPVEIRAGSGVLSGNLVSTSRSIVTIPIIDDTVFSSGNSQVTVVGFLQAFINCVEDGAHSHCDQPGSVRTGNINITVLNVVGCNNGPSTAPPAVGGSGTSAIAIRLITP